MEGHAEIRPRCFNCLTYDVSVKVIDLAGCEHWFCATCWQADRDLHDRIMAMLSKAVENGA